MPVILVADDIKDDRDFIEGVLRENGYDVVSASNPESASSIIDLGQIDAAILDYKLTDGSKSDKTGLFVAKTTNPRIPKIMVSKVAEIEEIRRTIDANKDGLPLVISFLKKESYKKDPNLILEAVKAALKTGNTWRRQSRENLKTLLTAQDKAIKWIDRLHSGVYLLSTLVFLGLMITVVYHIHDGAAKAILMLVALLAAEITNVLIAKKGHSSSTRADNYHNELLQAYRYEQLLASCDEIENPALRDQIRSELVRRTTDTWFADSIEATKIKRLE